VIRDGPEFTDIKDQNSPHRTQVVSFGDSDKTKTPASMLIDSSCLVQHLEQPVPTDPNSLSTLRRQASKPKLIERAFMPVINFQRQQRE
jgi:hypothetical protein